MPKAVLWGIGLLVCELPMEGEKCNYFDASADQQVASKKEKKKKEKKNWCFVNLLYRAFGAYSPVISRLCSLTLIWHP